MQEREKEQADAYVRQPDLAVGVGLVRCETRLESQPGDERGGVRSVEEGFVREREDDKDGGKGEEEDCEALRVWLSSRAAVQEGKARSDSCGGQSARQAGRDIGSMRTENGPAGVLVDERQALLSLQAERRRAGHDKA